MSCQNRSKNLLMFVVGTHRDAFLQKDLYCKYVNGEMILNKCGVIANDQILKTIKMRNNILISDWVVMPNHVHMLIGLRDMVVETPRGASLQDNRKGLIIKYSYRNHLDYYKRLKEQYMAWLAIAIL